MKFTQKEKLSIKEFVGMGSFLIYNLNEIQLQFCLHIIKKEYIEGAHFCNKNIATGIKIYGQNCYAFFNGNPYEYGLGNSSNKNLHDMCYSDFIRKFG